MKTNYKDIGINHALAKMRANVVPGLSICVIAEAYDEMLELLSDASWSLNHDDVYAREKMSKQIDELLSRLI